MHIDDVVGHSDGISNGLDEGHALDAAASIQHATKKHFQWNSPIEEVVLSRFPLTPPPLSPVQFAHRRGFSGSRALSCPWLYRFCPACHPDMLACG